MTQQDNKETLLLRAEHFIQSHPKKLIGQFEWQGRKVWIKRRPFSKKNAWHQIQGTIARLTKLPILASTAFTGHSDGLRHEAERLQHFLHHNISVPHVLGVTDTFLLTEDVGQQLQKNLDELTDDEQIKSLLIQAISTLRELHHKGLCHGRPALRDMTLKDEIISFIDLEEDPLKVMTLSQAQARDVWLFLNSAARYCKHDLTLLQDLFRTYEKDVSEEARIALKKMVNLLKPLRILLSTPLKARLGRDVQCALKANKALENCF